MSTPRNVIEAARDLMLRLQFPLPEWASVGVDSLERALAALPPGPLAVVPCGLLEEAAQLIEQHGEEYDACGDDKFQSAMDLAATLRAVMKGNE